MFQLTVPEEIVVCAMSVIDRFLTWVFEEHFISRKREATRPEQNRSF